jgi:hypothetical protein
MRVIPYAAIGYFCNDLYCARLLEMAGLQTRGSKSATPEHEQQPTGLDRHGGVGRSSGGVGVGGIVGVGRSGSSGDSGGGGGSSNEGEARTSDVLWCSTSPPVTPRTSPPVSRHSSPPVSRHSLPPVTEPPLVLLHSSPHSLVLLHSSPQVVASSAWG